MKPTSSKLNKNHNLIRVEIVTTAEQMLHAQAIRAICFMEEQGVSARQTLGGTTTGHHIIVYTGDEPVGTARIRWFKDFAKMERTSFREAWRDVRTIKRCAEFNFEHIARKGYDRVITHAKPKYARLWQMMLGFQPAAGKEPLFFEGHDEPYHELVKILTPPTNSISPETDTAILFRIEGYWDDRSEFEGRSLCVRPAAHPKLADVSVDIIMDRFRSQLQQVVTLHTAMFDKLLFEAEECRYRSPSSSKMRVTPTSDFPISSASGICCGGVHMLKRSLIPASNRLGAFFRRKSGLSHGFAGPNMSHNQSKTRRTGRELRRSVSASA